jgi:hypothetical protein
MKKTLQDQYLLIKEGKGHNGVFLADAKRTFPQYVPNIASFDEAVASLKTKNIISENIVGLSVVSGYEPKKKESYETAFEAFLAEARKKKEDDEKAELKKPSKQVEEDLDKQYDKEDDKNPDNLIFDQVMTGYYAEMKDPKNADKTMQQLKDIVLKNLAKDPIFYTKEGQFGVKDLGYTTEAPGLGTPKEPKGKYASSGYGNLNEGLFSPMTEKDINMMDELDLKSKLTMMGVTPLVIDSIISTSGIEGLRDSLRNKLKDRAIGFKESKEIEDFKASVKKAFTDKPTKKFTPEEIEAKLNQLYPGRAERKKDTPEESKLREVIREMIDSELGEAYQMFNVNPSAGGGEGGRRFIPNQLPFPQNVRKRFGDHIVYNPASKTLYVSQILYNNLVKGYGDQPAIKKLIMDIPPMVKQVLNKTENYGPVTQLPKQFKTYLPLNIEVEKAKADKFNKAGTKQYWSEGDFLIPNLNVMEENLSEENEGWEQKWEASAKDKETVMYFKRNMAPEEWSDFLSKHKEDIRIALMEVQSLKESVEKDLADINKEAEHEVLQSKLDKIDALIDHKRSKLNKLDEDEDMKALTDKKKVKELEKDIKKLEQARAKVEKMLGKTKGKKKEVIDETDDEMIDENIPLDDNMMGEEMSYEENY